MNHTQKVANINVAVIAEESAVTVNVENGTENMSLKFKLERIEGVWLEWTPFGIVKYASLNEAIKHKYI